MTLASGCQRENATPVVYLAQAGRLLALDSRDGRERWQADLPSGLICDVAPSPDGRWVAVLQQSLVLLGTERPSERIVLEPPEGWFFPGCLRSYGRVDSPGALLHWIDGDTVLVLLRRSVGGQEIRGITTFDLRERSWRPWVQELVLGCWLLAQSSADFQLSCERLRYGRWPVAFSGLLGIDPANGVIRRWVTLSPPQRFAALGVPPVSPVVGVAEGDEQFYVLTESGLLLVLDRATYVVDGVLVWQEAGLPSRASGKALQLADDGAVAWVLLWQSDGHPVLALVELRSRTVPRTLLLDARVVDVDFLDEGEVLLLLDDGAVSRLTRRELRSNEERELGTFPAGTTCCWVGPLAPTN
ncbi:MAG: hypothetical protein NZL87_04600 [Thermomicrobium sp.]|nr:hypothetical protein [Thermomicrobium sp.]